MSLIKETEDTGAFDLDLCIRVLSAIVMIAVGCTGLYFGGYVLFAIAAIVCFLMMLDVSNAFNKSEYGINRPTVLFCSLIVIPALYFFGSAGYILVTALGISTLAILTIFNKNHNFKSLITGTFSFVYPMLPASILVLLTVYDIKNNSKLGSVLIFAAVLCACISDAFAYFGGRLFGKKKLCPDISPKKTIAGSIASFVGGLVSGIILSLLADKYIEMGAIRWILIGFLCGGFAQIGDLLASMLKRFCGVKDYGKYIPGHGGIMDRMDSISVCLFAIVTFTYIFFTKVI